MEAAGRTTAVAEGDGAFSDGLIAQRDAPVGGQAVLEGVMMRGVSTWAVAVRKPAPEDLTEEGEDRPPAHALQARMAHLMKTEIHPEYVEAHVRCTCGNEFTTRSTKGDMHVEICSNCHPFYTGKQKLVDTGGRVERFKRRAAKRARG